MPPTFVPLSHMTTHPSTKNAHPGAPDMLAPHCTHQEVEVACQEAAVKQAEEMALQDEKQEQEWQKCIIDNKKKAGNTKPNPKTISVKENAAPPKQKSSKATIKPKPIEFADDDLSMEGNDAAPHCPLRRPHAPVTKKVMYDEESAGDAESVGDGSEDEYAEEEEEDEDEGPESNEELEDEEDKEDAGSKKKFEDLKKVVKEDGVDEDWNTFVKERAWKKTKSSSSKDNNDTMFQYGGIIADNETDEVEARAVLNKKRAAKASGAYSMVKVKPNPEAPPKSMKEACRGTKNWKHVHLPNHAATEVPFKDVVVPQAHKKAGALNPWAALTVEDLQTIVDEVFKGKGYKVAEDNIWYQLMKSHLEYWHNGFAAHAMQAIEALVCENGQTLTNKELVAEEIAMHLDDAELLVMADYTYRTFAYQWATWSKDKENRKGFGQTQLVLYTFANAHLAHLEGIESVDDLMNAKPIGVLIMSIQAVGRALECWKMGEKPDKNDKKNKLPAFSKENYGDRFERDNKNKQHTKHIHRAMIFVKLLEVMNIDEWKAIIIAALNYLLDKKRSRACSTSTTATLVNENVVKDLAEDFVMF